MTDQDLVVLKDNKKLVLDTDTLHPHINYRCITMDKEVLVYGIIFSKTHRRK